MSDWCGPWLLSSLFYVATTLTAEGSDHTEIHEATYGLLQQPLDAAQFSVLIDGEHVSVMYGCSTFPSHSLYLHTVINSRTRGTEFHIEKFSYWCFNEFVNNVRSKKQYSN